MTGGNAFRTNNRPFGNNNMNGNRSNAFSNGTENAFRRDRDPVRQENGSGSRFSDSGSTRFASMNGSSASRFSNSLNPNATASANNSTNNSNSRYGNNSDMRYGNNTTGGGGGVGGVGGSGVSLRESGSSRFSAPNPPPTVSRFSSSDAYNSKSTTASGGNDFYQNSSAKFKPYPDTNKSAYGESKLELPLTGSTKNGTSIPYPPPYGAYGSESMFSYPPPPIH